MDTRGTVRALFALLIAVVFGGAAVVFLFQLITSYQARIEEAQKPEDTVMVMVAARDLYPGVTIHQDDLVALEIPPRFLPGGVYLTPEHVVGQRPRERILTNEFIRAGRLANPESGEGLNAIIPRQMRAISIKVKDGAALSGFLDPGNYVDIIVTTSPDDGRGTKNPETHTILQSMFVLAVNNLTQRGAVETGRDGSLRTVTLMATADQAKALAYAEQVGEIMLSLRNDLDTNTFVQSTGVDISGVVGLLEKRREVRTREEPKKKAAPKPAPAPAPVVEEPKAPVVKIIQGSTVKDVEVENQ